MYVGLIDVATTYVEEEKIAPHRESPLLALCSTRRVVLNTAFVYQCALVHKR